MTIGQDKGEKQTKSRRQSIEFTIQFIHPFMGHVIETFQRNEKDDTQQTTKNAANEMNRSFKKTLFYFTMIVPLEVKQFTDKFLFIIIPSQRNFQRI